MYLGGVVQGIGPDLHLWVSLCSALALSTQTGTVCISAHFASARDPLTLRFLRASWYETSTGGVPMLAASMPWGLNPLSAVYGGQLALKPQTDARRSAGVGGGKGEDARCRSRARTELCAQRTPSSRSCVPTPPVFPSVRVKLEDLPSPGPPPRSHSAPWRRAVVWTARRADGQLGWTTVEPLTTDLTTALSAT